MSFFVVSPLFIIFNGKSPLYSGHKLSTELHIHTQTEKGKLPAIIW